jgi:hypothetical protein
VSATKKPINKNKQKIIDIFINLENNKLTKKTAKIIRKIFKKFKPNKYFKIIPAEKLIKAI